MTDEGKKLIKNFVDRSVRYDKKIHQ
jgi:hypothetical protein